MSSARRTTLWTWAVSSAVALVLLAISAALGATVYRQSVGEALALSALQSLAVLLALRFPRWSVGLVTIAAVSGMYAAQATPSAPWPIPVATLLALLVVFGAAAARGRWVFAGAGAAIVGITATGVASDLGVEIPAGPVISNLIVTVALSAIVIGVGTLFRSVRSARGQLAEARELTELELARRQIAEERTRIAREMHDVVAHGMSVIQVQAASARYRYPELADEVADEFDDLAATARVALGEMRALLGVLRADDDAEHAPQPGLVELPELAARSRATLDDQLPVSLRERMDPICQLAVYRVVQESLGNAARHAPGAAASVALTGDAEPTGAPSRVRVMVRNVAPPSVAGEGPVVAPLADASGHGIRGMRERVGALGGSLSAEPTPDGGFCVVALVPVVPGAPGGTPSSESPGSAARSGSTASPTSSSSPAAPTLPQEPRP